MSLPNPGYSKQAAGFAEEGKTLTIEGPALPAPWEVNIAVKSWRVSEPTGTLTLTTRELDFLLPATD